MKFLPIALLTSLALAQPAHSKLRPAEQKIVQSVDQENERTIQLLERMVNQNSGSLNLQGVEEVGRMARAELEPLGFKVRWIDMKETGRAGHIVATHKGNGRGKRMVLIGHLDTVFEPDSPFQRFERQGDRATGPGIGDDKGGIAVIVAALRAMHAAGTLKQADIMVVLTGDEEKTGSPIAVARRDLIEAGKWADVALEFENVARENGVDFGSVARRSSTNWQITVKAKSGHSSGIFGPGASYGAINELARIVDTFRRELPEQNLTFNVGVMAGGTPASIDEQGIKVTAAGKTNIIPEAAVARGDLRTLTREQDERIRARMQQIVAQHLRGTEAEMTFFENSYPPMEPTEGNRALLTRLNVVNADLGLPAMAEFDPGKRGAADSSFVAKDADTLAGMGVAGGGAHAEGEWVDLLSLPVQAKRAAILMTRLSREKRP